MSGLKRFFVPVNSAAYQVWERGQGRPVLFLHGFTGSGADFLPFFRVLSRDFRCLALDLPGHGATHTPLFSERMSVHQTAQDLMAICEQLGVDRPVVVGYSMGGRIALGAAVISPHWPAAIVLESASPGLSTHAQRTERKASDELLALRLEREGVASFMNYWAALPLFFSQRTLSHAALRRQTRIRMRQHADGLAASLRGAGTGAQPSWWEQLETLELASLLITGERDEKFTVIAEDMRVRMPSAVHVTVKEAGHNVHLERPQVWVSQLTAFLAGLAQ